MPDDAPDLSRHLEGRLASRVEIVTVRNLRTAADHASASDLFVFVDERDVLDRPGLHRLITDVAKQADLVVFDMYYRSGGDAFPLLMPGANPEYVRAVADVLSRFAIRGTLLRRLMQDGVCNPSDLLARAIDRLLTDKRPEAFQHLDFPILETCALEAPIEALQKEIAIAHEAAPNERDGDAFADSVTVVICTKDNGVLLDQLLGDLVTLAAVRDIVVVSNQTSNFVAIRTLDRWKSHPMVCVIDYKGVFNFSDQCNLAAGRGMGQFLLFLNDDIITLNRVWLDRLLAALSSAEVGVVGPRLLYPNERIQHAGMYLGFHGTAGHTMRHAKLPQDDYLFMASAPRDVSCVTGAVLLMRRSTFEDLGGFDVQLRTAYQDVDLCLRVRGLNQRVLFVPEATLLHLESISIARQFSSKQISNQRFAEHKYFLKLYGSDRLQYDQFHNGAWDKNDETLRSLA